ncbi:1,25-dihydroxyvitamin D(3) 24-hydroxylase, mitochondrial-like [Glandiceps talaboti]
MAYRVSIFQGFAKRHCRLLPTAHFSSASQEPVNKADSGQVKSFDELPGPGTGFFGALVFVVRIFTSGMKTIKDPSEMMKEIKKKYGPIWKQSIGALVTVNLSDPKDFEMVLRNEGKYPTRIPFQPWIQYRNYRGHPLGVLLHEGEDWHRNRAALSKRMLRPREVSSYNDAVTDVINDTLAKVIRDRKSNKIVQNLEDIVFKWSLESACAIILNKKMNLLDDKPHPEAQEFIQAVHDMFNTTTWLFVIPSAFQQKVNSPIWRKHVRAWDVIFTTAKKLIDEKMGEVTQRTSEGEDIDEEETDFITYMASQGTLKPGEIYANATDLLAAAVDTTSNTFLWTLYCVAKHPEVQNSLYEEISRVVPTGKTPTYKDINQMPYLKAVLRETVRLYPPIATISRILDDDIIIRCYNIPAKTCIVGWTVLTGRDPELFKDPSEFRPERWLREEKEHFYGFKSLPFGYGPRMCMGKRLAELEIHLSLARISQQFILEATTDVFVKPTTILQPDRPLNLKFIDRIP